MIDIDDRARGALLGLAAGDALGTTVEFRRPGSFTPLTDMIGGGLFNLKPGQWTDDTSMALCQAESLIECGGFHPVDQLQRYVRWYREGHHSSTGRCFDIGNAVRQALHRFEHTKEPWCGSTAPNTAGNGSLMRLAPVPLFFNRDPDEAIARAADSSKTTHGAAEAVDACRYYCGLMIGALQGVTKEDLLQPMFTPVAGLWDREPLSPKIANVARGSFLRNVHQTSAAPAMSWNRWKPRCGPSPEAPLSERELYLRSTLETMQIRQARSTASWLARFTA